MPLADSSPGVFFSCFALNLTLTPSVPKCASACGPPFRGNLLPADDSVHQLFLSSSRMAQAAGGVASSTSPPSPLLSSFSTLMSQRHLQSLLQGRFSTLEAFLAEVLDAEYAAASLTSQEVRQSRTSAALTSGGYRATEDGGAVAKEKKDEEGRPPEEEMKSKRREDVLGVLTAVWEAVQQRRVKPCLRTWFYRTQYR